MNVILLLYFLLISGNTVTFAADKTRYISIPKPHKRLIWRKLRLPSTCGKAKTLDDQRTNQSWKHRQPQDCRSPSDKSRGFTLPYQRLNHHARLIILYPKYLEKLGVSVCEITSAPLEHSFACVVLSRVWQFSLATISNVKLIIFV